MKHALNANILCGAHRRHPFQPGSTCSIWRLHFASTLDHNEMLLVDRTGIKVPVSWFCHTSEQGTSHPPSFSPSGAWLPSAFAFAIS